MSREFEQRAASLEVRARGRRLEGYAALFGVEARLGDVTETISPGAFAEALAGDRDVLGLVDHDFSRVLARTRSGTLRLSQDTKGLAFDLDVPATTLGNDVLALAERGDLGGMSFAFRPSRGGETWAGSRRTLTAVDLREISIVQSFPAYEGTTVNARMKPPATRLSLARRQIEIAERRW